MSDPGNNWNPPKNDPNQTNEAAGKPVEQGRQMTDAPPFSIAAQSSGEGVVVPVAAADRWAGVAEDLRGPWGWLDLLYLVLFWFASQVAAGIVVGAVVVARGMDRHQFGELTRNPAVVVGVATAMFLLMMLFISVMLRVRYQAPFWRTVGWRALRPRTLPPAAGMFLLVLGGIGLALAVILLNVIFKAKSKLPIEEMFRDRQGVFLLMAMGILLAPVVEETIFRGYIYPVIARSWGVAVGVIATGTVFGLMHAPQLKGGTAQIVTLIVVGIVLTWVRAKTGTVLASFLVHLSYNSFLFLLTYAATEGFRKFPPTGG